MKASKKILLIMLFSFFIISCQKKDTIDIENIDFIINNTSDTLFCKIIIPTNPNNHAINIRLVPFEKIEHFKSLVNNSSEINIYKNNDTNNLFIGFYKTTEPFNYKKNIYNFSKAWELDTIITWYTIKFENSFTISYDYLLNNGKHN
ncbi:MAG TPA: hypothetical protein PKG63_00275 [Bacteroidales bacterium]|jgi:hypothetical protein|nr:hypothetical protein [Bacteroidales bacterium]